MSSSIEDITASISSKTDQELLIEQLAAVLCPQVVHTPAPVPIVADVSQILLQLSQAVAEARNEAQRERNLRLALELENEAIRSTQLLFNETSSTAESDEGILYGLNSRFPSPSPILSPSLEVVMDSSLSLCECLATLGSCPNPELVFICYQNAGFMDLDLSSVDRIYKPIDFGQVLFIVFNSFRALVPQELVPFSFENLQCLIASPTPIDGEEEAPRMNLLEALNVRSDDDCARIVTVRKCHKLGFKSQVHLRQYFQKYGKVERVVLLPMRAKPKGGVVDGRGNRPSSMGFVVMESATSVADILSQEVHIVKGWQIEVRNFVRPTDKPDSSVVSPGRSAW